MALESFSSYGQQKEVRRTPVVVSVSLHVLLFAAMLKPLVPEMPKPSKSEYAQAIAGREKEIVWYRFKKDLPDVTPLEKAPKKLPLKAETKAKQAITSSPKNAPKKKQIVWSPAPEIKLDAPPVESANLLAVKLPDPPRPKPKEFTPPDAKPAETSPAREMPPVPEMPVVKAEAPVPPNLPELPKPIKPFTPPPVRAQVTKPARPVEALPTPPEIQAKLNVPAPIKMGDLPKIRKPFVPPPVPAPLPVQKADIQPLTTPPDITASFDAGLPEIFHVPMSTPKKPFQAPATVAGRARKSIRLETAPSVPSEALPPGMQANSKELTMAVVGLTPIDKPALPTASSPAEFSAGPVIRKEGATSAGEAKGLAVPDIFVRGAKDAKPDLIARAYAPVTSNENIRETMRQARPTLTAGNLPQPVPLRINGAIQVSSAPDPVFQGRDVFMLAIQMPNLTSAAGSWLMWYADRNAIQKGLGPVAPPIAYRKVDPKYIATAIEERIEGRVQLACVIKRDGTVGGIELRQGLDERLNRSAQEALSKWEFTPATRNGVPVDVDVLVEIPFRLEPKVKGPY